MVPHSDVVALVRSRALSGRGMGSIDVHLLASAIVEQLSLWTADSRLFAVAKELGVAYREKLAELGWNVALFLPFRCTKERQTAASAGTKRRPKIAGFYE